MVFVSLQCAHHQPMDHHKALRDKEIKDLGSACTSEKNREDCKVL